MGNYLYIPSFIDEQIKDKTLFWSAEHDGDPVHRDDNEIEGLVHFLFLLRLAQQLHVSDALQKVEE